MCGIHFTLRMSDLDPYLGFYTLDPVRRPIYPLSYSAAVRSPSQPRARNREYRHLASLGTSDPFPFVQEDGGPAYHVRVNPDRAAYVRRNEEVFQDHRRAVARQRADRFGKDLADIQRSNQAAEEAQRAQQAERARQADRSTAWCDRDLDRSSYHRNHDRARRADRYEREMEAERPTGRTERAHRSERVHEAERAADRGHRHERAHRSEPAALSLGSIDWSAAIRAAAERFPDGAFEKHKTWAAKKSSFGE